MKKLLSLLLAVLIGFSSLTLSAQQMNVTIVANGTETSSYLPFYGLWADDAQHNQVIYNEGVMSDLIGSEIYGMTFYLPSTPMWAGQNFSIKLGIATPSAFTTPTYVNTALTTVYTGTLTVTDDTMHIEFTTPFTYDGGNLLFDLVSTAGSYSSSSYYGISSPGGGVYAYGSNGPNIVDFIPKTKVYYTGGASCLAPLVGEVTNITDHTAFFAWSPRASESAWEVLVAPSGADISEMTWTPVTDTTFSFVGLAANTHYTAYVRSDCGSETSGAMSVNFVTACDQEMLPFYEDFEALTTYEMPACWSAIPANYYYPYVYGYNAYNSANDLYNYQSSYDGNLDAFVVLPKLDTTVALNTLYIRFMLLAYGQGTMTIGAMTDPTDTSTFTPVQVIPVVGTDDDYIELETSFANYTGDAHYIAIRTQTGDYMSTYFDNIWVNLIPTCERPVAMSADSITDTEVYFSWTPADANGPWQVAIAPITDSLSENNLDWVATTDTTHFFENLNADTRYRLYVRTVCSDEFSETRFVDFRTACAVMAAPYQETFAGFEQTPSPCWTRYDGLANPTVTYTSSLTEISYGWYFSTNANTVFPLGHPYVNVYGSYVNYWLVSPAIDLSELTDPVLSFELALMTYSGGNPVTVGGQDDDVFMVMVSTDDGASWSRANATVWDNTPSGDYVYDNISHQGNDIYIPLSQYGDSIIRIAFYVESTESNGDNYLRLYNVNVMEAPECLRPETFTVLSVGVDEATVAWNADEDASNSWEVVIGQNGFTPDPDDAILTTTNQYTFENLTPNTVYEVYVRTVCEDNSVTAWSNMFTFMTMSGAPAELPYFCGFEDADENAEWSFENGVNTNKWYIGADSSAVHTGDSALYVSNDGGLTNSYSASATSNSWAYRDIVFPDDAIEFHVSFDWKGDAESCCDYLKVYIGNPGPVYAGLSDAPNGATQLGGNFNSATDWQTATLILGPSYAGTVKRLYFLWHNDGSVGNNPPISVDNISVTAENCARPTGILVSNETTNGVTLTIVPASENDSEWEVMIVSDTVITETSQTITFDVTGLAPATHYTVYARTICGDGDTSSYSLPVTFNTGCSLITSLPVTWDLESNNIGGTSAYPLPACWTRQAGTNYPYTYDYDYYAHSGNNSLYFNNYQPNKYVALTEIDTNVLDITDLQLSFYAALTNNYYGDADIVVGVMTDPTDIYTFTPVDTVTVSSSSYLLIPFDVQFDNYTGYGSYIAIMNSVSGTDNYSSTVVDDITLEMIPLCSRPKDLVAVPDMTTADLSWTSNATAYTVYYRPTGTPTWQSVTGVTTNSTQLTGLTSGTQYEWYVETACGGENEQTSVTSTFLTPLCPAANQCTYTFNLSDSYGDGWNGGFLTVKQGGSTVAVLNFTDGSYMSVPVNLCHGDSTVIEWTGGSYQDEASFILLAPDGTTLYTSPSMDSYSTPYAFVSDCGFGPIVTDPTVATAPASNISQTSATLNGSITNPDNVTLTAQGFEWKLSTAADYTVVNAAGNVMSYDLNNLTANTAYVYRAFIVYNGTTIYGSDETFTTLAQGQLTEPSATTAAATAITQTAATLNGTISNPDDVTITAQGFEWKATVGGTYSVVNATGTTMTYNLTGLTASTNYTFRAFVTTANGTHYGAELTFTTLPEEVQPCNVPTGLTAGEVTKESIAISWDNDADVNSWNIQYRPVGGTLSSATATTNSYTITGLTPETQYEIQVQADCGDGNLSEWSSAITVTTLTDGIENYLLNSISLYPNPAKEYIDVRVDEINVTSMEVFDVYGKLINSVNVVDNPTRINVSNLAAGMYFVRVTTEQGVATKSFVKK